MESRLSQVSSQEPRISVLNSLKLEYVEADHVMIIPVDLRHNTLKTKLSDGMTWDYPHHADVVNDEKKSEILGNVFEYLKTEGYSC